MSRPFVSNEEDCVAVLFEYAGEDYLTCTRQEDSNSNIGYCLIRPQCMDKVKIKGTMEYKLFDEMYMSSKFITCPKEVLLHHGLPQTKKLITEIKDLSISELMWKLPKIYEREIYGVKGELMESSQF